MFLVIIMPTYYKGSNIDYHIHIKWKIFKSDRIGNIRYEPISGSQVIWQTLQNDIPTNILFIAANRYLELILIMAYRDTTSLMHY